MVSATIDLQRLSPFIEGIWTIEEAQSAFSSDFTQPVKPEVKEQLWQTIKLARFWKQIFPSARIESMKFMNPGNGGVG